jgi:hypothetical protein
MATHDPTTSRRAFINAAAVLSAPVAAVPALTAPGHPDAALIEASRKAVELRATVDTGAYEHGLPEEEWDAAVDRLMVS